MEQVAYRQFTRPSPPPRLREAMFTHKFGAPFSSSDAEEITMLPEHTGISQLQHSSRVVSSATLLSETFGACRQFSSEMEEPLASEVS